MKRCTKNNIALVLQVFAVVILFGYPGCSTMHQSDQNNKTGLTGFKQVARAVSSRQ